MSQPSIDADGAGALAIEQHDTNGDGVVAGGELDQAPCLRALRATTDANQDGALSAEEVTARIEAWQAMRTGLTSFPLTVTLDGRPLAGATVTFVPAAFLGDEIKPAICETDLRGGGSATIANADRPDPTTPPGMHLGVYLVKISRLENGRETIPARYNRETTLGQELAADVPEILNNRVLYALTKD